MVSLFKEVVEIINEMQYELDKMNENAKKIFIECQKIIGILTGNIDFLINDYNKNNIHLVIMANIFYRFYQNNFIHLPMLSITIQVFPGCIYYQLIREELK